jgi:FtsP/CotA-like multicopper oxidase with cupredoxin domain
MKKLAFILLTFLSSSLFGQIDFTKLIIGRNTGTHTFHDGEQTRIFGFTETLSAPTRIPGPIIYVNSGDSVKIDFWNMSQGAPHTIHLHGLDVDQQNDGVGMLSFEVMHDTHGYYYFKAPHPGTYLYHCHVGSTVHLQAGMYGLVIVRPNSGDAFLNWDGGETYGREFPLLASEIDTVWHNDTILDHEHDSLMPLYVPSTFKPQYFLVNGKSGTQLTDPLNYLFALKNEKVYMRLANIGYYGVRYIFPASLNARTVSSDGRPLPMEFESDTIEVLPGERYETFLQLGMDQFYPFLVEHFNLNTQVTEASQTMIIQTSSVSLIENEEQTLLIYPNPSSGLYTLSGNIEENYTVTTLDGKLLFQSKSNTIDLTQYTNGLYLLTYKGNSHLLIKD